MPTKMDQYLEIICIKANRDLRRKYYNVIEQVLFLPPDRPVQCAIRWLLLGVMMGSSSVHVLLAVGNGSIWFSRHDGLLKSFCSLSVNFLWTCMMIIASSWKDDSALDLWSHSSSMIFISRPSLRRPCHKFKASPSKLYCCTDHKHSRHCSSKR